MKSRTNSIQTLLVAACASALFFGCSSSSSPATTPPADTGAADTAKADTSVDTGPKVDTGTPVDDTGGATCPTPLPSGYKCPATPAKPAAGTACTATDVQGLFDACYGASADSTKCSAYKSASTACDTCIAAWTRKDGWLQTAGCYLTVDSTATDCAGSDECDDDCTNVVCYNDCTDQTTLQSCLQTAQGTGSTCDPSVKYATLDACQKNAKFAGCQIPNDADIVRFYMNACHDNGAFVASPPGDAGTETGTSDAADAADGG